MGKHFAKFFICPNCKAPIFRKSALGTAEPNCKYCGKCGTEITTAIKMAIVKKKH